MLEEQRVLLPCPEEPALRGLEGFQHPASLRRKRTVPVTFQQTAPTPSPASPQAFPSPQVNRLPRACAQRKFLCGHWVTLETGFLWEGVVTK